MTLEEAIKRYTSNSFYEKSDGNLQGYLEFNQLAEWLKELKQLRNQTRWIPVSERFPNLDDYTGSEVWQKKVLITGYLSFDDKKDTFVSEAFAKDVICNCVNNIVITAWQPIPKPYKPEKGGE